MSFPDQPFTEIAACDAVDESSLLDVICESVQRRVRQFTSAEREARRQAVQKFYEENRDPAHLTVEEWEARH